MAAAKTAKSPCTIKANTKQNTYKITFDHLTKGELLSLMYSVLERSDISPVAKDLVDYLRNALSESGENELLKELVPTPSQASG